MTKTPLTPARRPVPYAFDDRVLLLMMGLPYSGKTTRALALSRALSAPIVSPDAIRLAMTGQRFLAPLEPDVWVRARVMVRSLFLAGHTVVIVDATNTTRKRRDQWRGEEGWQTRIIFVDEPWTLCRQRAECAEDAAILAVIERMAENLERPYDDEPLADPVELLDVAMRYREENQLRVEHLRLGGHVRTLVTS